MALKKKAQANGQSELAKWLQANAPFLPMLEMKIPEKLEPPDPLAPADLLAEQEKWDEACDAYLVALRANPNLFTYSSEYRPIRAFKQADRLLELIEFFDKTTLQKMKPSNYGVEGLLFAALSNNKTRDAGYAYLERVFLYKPNSAFLLLQKFSERDFWKEVPDPLVLLRLVFLPDRYDEPDWGRLEAELYYSDIREPAESSFASVQKILEQSEKIDGFSKEVRQLISLYPSWESGWAILALMESAAQNHAESISIIRSKFLDAPAIKIPPSVAWALGESLAWRDKDLDLVVIELLEKSLRELSGVNYNIRRQQDANVFGPQEDSSLRFSPIRTLAELYASNGRQTEARQLLYGLISEKNQHPLLRGYVINQYDPSRQYTGDTSCKSQRCNACHRGVKSFYDHIALSDTITNIGYPVDAYVALADLDHSFYQVFTSPPGWIESESSDGKSLNEIVFREHSYPRRFFDEQIQKTASKITAKSVSDALDRDTFWRYTKTGNEKVARIIELIQLIDGSDEKTKSLRELGRQHVSSQNMPQVGTLILMLSLRGIQETAEPTVFSPVIEMLELAVYSNATNNKQAILELDQKLARLWEQENNSVDVSIAATVFAFLRYDIDAAGKRIKKLLAERAEKPSEPVQSDLGFWLVARNALTDDRTKIAGKQLAELAIAAAEKETDPRWKQAMLRELGSSVQQ